MCFDISKLLRRCGLWAAIVAVTGCTAAARASDPSLPRVLATTTVVADLVRQVAGDRVALDCLMAPGIDPHSYKATPRDADRLARARLVVASGLHLEGKLGELLGKLAARTRVVAVAESLPRDRLLEVAPDLADPHVWFDPRLWSLCAPVVAEALAEIDPPGAAVYRKQALEYAARLAELDATLRGMLATIPPERRVLVTAHDAFRYFGRAFAVEVVGVQGTSTESEAGLADINRLVELVVTRSIPAVFVETSVSDRNVQALQEGARSRGHTVKLGGRLYSDSLGAPGSGAETLEAVLHANVATIVAGLSGDQ